jgi:hypothetical protein
VQLGAQPSLQSKADGSSAELNEALKPGETRRPTQFAANATEFTRATQFGRTEFIEYC